MRTLLLELACLVLAGCGARHAVRSGSGVNYLVRPECKPTLQLIDCDDAEPPHCKGIIAHYDKGCEIRLADPARKEP